MLSRIYELFETVLGWLERTPWGQKVIALVVSAAVTLWAYLTTKYPPVALVIVFIVLLWMTTDLEARLLPRILKRLKPPVSIEAKNIRVTTGIGQTESQKAMRWVDCWLHILNRSTLRRVSLTFRVSLTDRSGEVSVIDSGLLSLSQGMTTNLGPEEETAGVIRFYIPSNDMVFDFFQDRGELLVSDRLSRRSVAVPMRRSVSAGLRP